jgi:hypothetical protein
MAIMESMSQAEFDEIKQGLKSWLEKKRNASIHMKNADPTALILMLIDEVETSARRNLFPWEDK